MTPVRTALLLLLFACTGCERYVYRPRGPQAVEAHGLQVSITRVRFLPRDGEDFRLELDVEAPAGSVLRSAWLAREGDAPCGGGLSVVAVYQGTQWVSRPPLPLSGREQLALEFPRLAAWRGPLAAGARLDLALAGEDCVSVPVSHPKEGWVRDEGFSLAFGARSYHLLSPVQDVQPRFVGYAGAGHWLGPVRLGLELGFGLGSQSHVLVHLSPALEGTLWQRGMFALGASGAYGLLLAGPEESRGLQQGFLLHGPRAGLHFLLAVPPEMRAGFPGGARLASAGLALEGGYLMRTAGGPFAGSGMLGLSFVLQGGS